jgi:integrase
MGFSPLLISERLGHENIETTLQTYSHLYPNKHSEVADRLQMLNQKATNENDENKK